MAYLRRFSFNAVILVLAYCGYASWQAFQHEQHWRGLWWLVGGAGLLLLTIPPVEREAPTTTGPLWTGAWWRRGLGVLMVIASLWPLYRAYQQFNTGDIPTAQPWNHYLMGVSLWVGGLLLLSAYERWRWPVIPLVLIEVLALALWLRVYDLPHLPANIWYDEAVNVLQARRMLDENYRPIFVDNMTTPHLFLYRTALAWFGRTNITAVRWVTVLLSMGGVLMAYLVGQRLHGRAFGLWMAFFLAVATWAVNFTRMAMTGIETVFFTLLSFYFLHRLTRHAKWHDAVLLGVAAGTGLWFYSAFRTIGLALAVYWVLGWRFWKPRHLLLSGVAGLTALVVIYPLALFAFKLEPELFSARLEQVSLFNDKTLGPLSRQDAFEITIKAHLRMFHILGDGNGRHNLPLDPMLDPFAGALMVFGLGAAVRYLRRRTAEVAFFVTVAGASLFLGISTLWFEAPQGLRTIGILAALAYAVALVANSLLQVPSARVVGFLAVVGIIGGMTTWNYDKYFNRMAHDYRVWHSFSANETQIVPLTEERDDHPVMINAFLTGSASAGVLLDGEWPWIPIKSPQVMPLTIPATQPLSLILYPPSDGPIFEMAQQLYPNGHFIEVDAGYYGLNDLGMDTLLYTIIDLEAADIAGPQGLAWDGTGLLYIPRYDLYRFWVEDAPLYLDGQLIEPGTEYRLAQGLHTVTMDGNKHPIEWAGPDIVGVEAVPEHYLFHAPVAQYGLYGRFYNGEDTEAESDWERIDPYLDFYVHDLPLPRPYTAIWTGQLVAPETGNYSLWVELIGRVRLWLDDALVVEFEAINDRVIMPLTLTAGGHDLRVEFYDSYGGSRLHLRWQTPTGSDRWQSIPPTAYRPTFGVP